MVDAIHSRGTTEWAGASLANFFVAFLFSFPSQYAADGKGWESDVIHWGSYGFMWFFAVLTVVAMICSFLTKK